MPIAPLSNRVGLTRCARCIRASGSTPSGNIFRNAFARDAGLRIDHLLLSPAVAGRLVATGVDRDIRGRDHASDPAPVWIELADAVAGRRHEHLRKTIGRCSQTPAPTLRQGRAHGGRPSYTTD